jgi:hypothetical protein
MGKLWLQMGHDANDEPWVVRAADNTLFLLAFSSAIVSATLPHILHRLVLPFCIGCKNVHCLQLHSSVLATLGRFRFFPAARKASIK